MLHPIKTYRSFSHKRTQPSSDEHGDIEAWEIDYELLHQKDYSRLLQYRKKRAESRPNDYWAQYYLGEAYIFNQDYVKAINFLSDCHKQYPSDQNFKHLILDALFALGKDENDFNWVEKPVVLRLTKDILNACHDYLKPKRKPRSAYELHCNFMLEGYLTFSEMDLLNSLIEDERFIVEDPDFAGVQVRR